MEEAVAQAIKPFTTSQPILLFIPPRIALALVESTTLPLPPNTAEVRAALFPLLSLTLTSSIFTFPTIFKFPPEYPTTTEEEPEFVKTPQEKSLTVPLCIHTSPERV